MPSIQNVLVPGDVTEKRGEYPEEAPEEAIVPDWKNQSHVTLTNLKGLQFCPGKDCDGRVFITKVGPLQQAILSVGDKILPREGIKQTDVYSDMLERLKPSTRGPMAIFVNKEPILCDGTKVKSLMFSVSRRVVVFKKPNPDPEATMCKNKVRLSALIVHFP